MEESLLLPSSLIILCFYPMGYVKANKSFSEEVLQKLWTNSKLLALKQVNTHTAFSNNVHLSIFLLD